MTSYATVMIILNYLSNPCIALEHSDRKDFTNKEYQEPSTHYPSATSKAIMTVKPIISQIAAKSLFPFS